MTVKDYRERLKITQQELSIKANISIQQLQKIEQGKIYLQNVKFIIVKDLYDNLNIEDVTIDMFVDENDWAISCKKKYNL